MEDKTPKKAVTLGTLRRMIARGEKLAMLTCYDATTIVWLARGGLKMVLVGDSMANVILGEPSSIHAPLDMMIRLTHAVKRAAPTMFIMGDMPFMSYQVSTEQAIENAGRMMVEGRADAVKFELEPEHTQMVAKLTQAGIPVVGHLGWKPQRAPLSGVRTAKVAGRTVHEVRSMVEQSQALEEAGAIMLLIEQVTEEACQAIVDAVDIPVIGCGAGAACHGHVVVLQDLLGMSDRSPSFAPVMSNFGEQLSQLSSQWINLLNSGEYMKNHPYHMTPGEHEKLNEA